MIRNLGGKGCLLFRIKSFALMSAFTTMLLTSGCSESSSHNSKSPERPAVDTSKSSDEGDATSKQSRDGAKSETLAKNKPTESGAFFMDYPARYCEHVWRLKLRADVSEQLKYFCDGSKPTKELLEWREKFIREPGKIEVKRIFYEGSKENETSEVKMVWGYYLADLRPFRVKEKPLYSFIARSLTDEIVNMKSDAVRQNDDGVDFGMHLWSTKMSYNLQVLAAPGLTLSSLRDTQYNLYQVESGNEEMGFGVETLTDGHGADYTKSVMLNLSFNDGMGFNDDNGGAVIINMLHLKMANKGFVETTEKTLTKIGDFFANSMYEGLTGKKK